jgi:predicted dehydrogenase
VSARIGLIGCGRWGRHILRDLAALGAEVTVVARSPESRQRARDGGANRIVAELDALPALDGIVVATPTSLHAETVEAVLDRGVAVFVEKPLSTDPLTALRIAAAAPDRVFVMDKWRHHPGVELLRDLACSGELGTPVALHTTRVGWGNPHEVDAVWVLVSHELSIELEVLGQLTPPQFARAEAAADAAVGLTAVLGELPWHALTVSAASPVRRREVWLVCSTGSASLADPYEDHVLLQRAGGELERRSISTEPPLLRELRAFLEHLNGGPPPRSSAAHGAEIVQRIAELRALAGI